MVIINWSVLLQILASIMLLIASTADIDAGLHDLFANGYALTMIVMLTWLSGSAYCVSLSCINISIYSPCIARYLI